MLLSEAVLLPVHQEVFNIGVIKGKTASEVAPDVRAEEQDGKDRQQTDGAYQETYPQSQRVSHDISRFEKPNVPNASQEPVHGLLVATQWLDILVVQFIPNEGRVK
jgi:hypothetical protein